MAKNRRIAALCGQKMWWANRTTNEYRAEWLEKNIDDHITKRATFKNPKKQTCKTERIFRNIFVAATEIVRNACHILHPLFIFYHLDFALTTSWNTRRKKKSERKCQQLLIITKVGSVSNMYKLLNNTFPFLKKEMLKWLCTSSFQTVHLWNFSLKWFVKESLYFKIL